MTLRSGPRVVLLVYLGVLYATLGVVRDITEGLRAAGLLRGAVAVAFAVVAAAVLVAVMRHPGGRTRRVLAVLAVSAAACAAAVWPMSSPEEKVHFLEYGAVALLADTAAPTAFRARARFAACALFTAAAGAVDEGIQALLPNRYADARDVALNAAAGLLALAALAALRWARSSHRPATGG